MKLKKWQRVAAIAEAVRMVERRVKRAEEDGRDPVILVRLAERIHAQLVHERLAWEGVTDVGT